MLVVQHCTRKLYLPLSIFQFEIWMMHFYQGGLYNGFGFHINLLRWYSFLEPNFTHDQSQVANDLCPTTCAPSISPGQKCWQTDLEIKISCNQWEGLACTHEGFRFSLCWVGGGGGAAASHTLVVFVFSLVLNVFLSCSHRIPSSQYPRCSQYHLTSILYSLPKVQLPCTETEKVSTSFAHLFLFCWWGPKRCFYWGVSNFPTDLVMG
jgi:hypothetical protein